MNLNMFRPKNETEDLILSFTKNFGTIIKQTRSHPQETPESEFTNPRETFSFKPSLILGLDSKWMIGLLRLEVYISIFNETENKKFELHIFPDSKNGGSTCEKVRDQIEKDLEISDITATDLQDEIIGAIFFQEYKKEESNRMNDEAYMILLSKF